MASSSSNANKIFLSSSDATVFMVEEEVALQFPLLKQLLAVSAFIEQPYPIPKVSGRTLSEMLKYYKKHILDDADDEALKEFDSGFTDELEKDQGLLFDVLEAAYLLRMEGLMDLLCSKIAGMMAGKTVEEIRGIFHIKNDFTPAEEEAISSQYPWAFP